MKRSIVIAGIVWIAISQFAFAQNPVNLVTTDIDNFWQAYDKIVATKDSASQIAYLKELFLDRVCISVKVATTFRSKLATPKESLAF